MKKAYQMNAKAIENRISYFKREEEKIWKDLEEVRRQAAKIEDGRGRSMEKKLAAKAIAQQKDASVHGNLLRAAQQKATSEAVRIENSYEAEKRKKLQWQKRRQEAAELLQGKKMMEMQSRLRNSERAVAVQRQQLEAKLNMNQLRAQKLSNIREQQERNRQNAEIAVMKVEQQLPMLEAEELLCVQRLQNSRIVTQSVLQELEQSLGATSPVASLLRSKAHRIQDGDGHVDENGLDSGHDFAPPPRANGMPL